MLDLSLYKKVSIIEVGQKLFWSYWKFSTHQPITVLKILNDNTFTGTSCFSIDTKPRHYYVDHENYYWLLIEDIDRSLPEDLVD